MKQSSKLYGVTKPHILFANTSRVFVVFLRVKRNLPDIGTGKDVLSAWADFKAAQDRHAEGLRNLRRRYEFPFEIRA